LACSGRSHDDDGAMPCARRLYHLMPGAPQQVADMQSLLLAAATRVVRERESRDKPADHRRRSSEFVAVVVTVS
jgi:hypothetical protein